VQCLHRWSKILKPGIVKGPWTAEQDRKLLEWVKTEGQKHWNQCAEYIQGRTGKQCRERWFNTLNPEINKGEWTAEEDFIIFETYRVFGSQWTKIAKKLGNGRTENSIKNRFYSTLRRIAAKKKNESWELNCNLPFNKIIEFLPDALNEKTLHYMNYLNENPSKEYHQYMRNSNEYLINKINQTKAYINEESSVSAKEQCSFESKESVPTTTHEQPKVQESSCVLNNNNDIIGTNNYLIKHNNNVYIINNQLNSFIEKLLSNKDLKIENCSGQTYYVDNKGVNSSESSRNYINGGLFQ